MLCYELPETGRARLSPTLESLSAEMASSAIPVGPFSILGLQCSETELSVVVDDQGGAFLGLPPGAHPIARREQDDDPRPLYFIPYDPDVAQSDEERTFSRSVLFRRMHSTIIAAVGSAVPPTELSLTAKEVLNDAMFGMFGLWENKQSATHMRRLFKQLMGAVQESVCSEVPESVAFEPGRGWTFTIGDDEKHGALLDVLTRFSADTLTSEPKPGPELFDSLEDD